MQLMRNRRAPICLGFEDGDRAFAAGHPSSRQAARDLRGKTGRSTTDLHAQLQGSVAQTR